MQSQIFTIQDQNVATAREAEDASHRAYMQAVRNTGRVHGFLVGVITVTILYLIWG